MERQAEAEVVVPVEGDGFGGRKEKKGNEREL